MAKDDSEAADSRAFKKRVGVGVMPVAATSSTIARGPFTVTLFRFSGAGGAWIFAPISKRLAPPVTRPWGRTPVHATVDGISWETSIWRDAKTDRSLLAVPARIRGKKGHGDTVRVSFSFEPETS